MRLTPPFAEAAPPSFERFQSRAAATPGRRRRRRRSRSLLPRLRRGGGTTYDPLETAVVGRRRLRQRERHVLRRLEAVLAVLLQAVAHDVVERGRDVASRLRQLRRLLPHDRGDRVARRVALERLLAGEQLVQDRAEGEDVRAVVDRQAADLLGRHVAHRAHHRAGLGVAAAGAGRRAGLLGRERRRRAWPGRSRGS